MADKETYVVKGMVAQLLGADGTYSHHYQGATVPELAEGEAERLHDEGLIGPDDQDFVVDPKTKKGSWVKSGSKAAKAAESAPLTGSNK